MTTPGLPPLFGAPWEQPGSYRLDSLIRDADQALTAAHREAGNRAASFPAGVERTRWVDYTNKVAHVRDEMRRMLKDLPGA